jgi:hypothetical protein
MEPRVANSRKRLLRYQFSLGGLILVSAALCVSLGLFKVAALSHRPEGFLAALGATMLLGAVIGAAIGQVFRGERGSAAPLGAWLGAVIVASVMLVGLVVLSIITQLLHPLL